MNATIAERIAAIRDHLDNADANPQYAIGAILIALSQLTDLVEEKLTKEEAAHV